MPDDVRAEVVNLFEVLCGLLGRGPRLAGGIGRERPVSNALHEELGFAQPEKLAVHAYA